MVLTNGNTRPPAGLKERIRRLMEAMGRTSLTMGQIMDKLDVDKVHASDVSSALYKLRSQGLIECFEGEASSSMGRRIVKRYRWVMVAQDAPQPTRVIFDPRMMLGRKL